MSVLYPNPATSKLNFVLSSKANEKAMIEVSNLEGKTVWQSAKSLIIGDNPISLNTSSLSKGVYSLKVTLEGEKEFLTERFIKQ